MKTFTVYKRMINDYSVAIDADSPEEALQKAIDGDHSPGELNSEYCDGEYYHPENWIIEGDDGDYVAHSDATWVRPFTVIGIFTNEQTFATIVQATSPEDAYRAAAQDILKESPSSLSFVTFIAAIPGDHVVEGDDWVNAEDLVGAE